MALTWKDGAGTLLVALAITLSAAILQGFDWFIFGNWRTSTMVLLIIGIAACIVANPSSPPAKNTWTTIASIIGSIGGIAALGAIIFNSQALFVSFTASIDLLWLLTTLHHLIRHKSSTPVTRRHHLPS